MSLQIWKLISVLQPVVIIPGRSVKAQIRPGSGGECVVSGETKDWHVWSLKISNIIIITITATILGGAPAISYISKP